MKYIKKLIKEFNNSTTAFKIVFILLIISLISSIIYINYSNKNRISTEPTEADIIVGLEKTFKEINNLNCSYYGKTDYSYPVYKYKCSFDYKLNDIEKNEYETCTVCIMKNKKWNCSVSSKKCFK